MTMKYPTLLSSIKIGELELPNRVAMAPMTRSRCGPTYIANDLMKTYYKQRATAGIIITEGTHISIVGRGWYGAPDIYTDKHVEAWKPVTSAVHEAGGLIFCQLWHTGRASHSSFRKGMPEFEGDKALSVAPSALKRRSHAGKQGNTPMPGEVDVETPRALTLEEIKGIPEEYRNAAQKAKEAGFDGVEIHSANGYLLDEFLQMLSNIRTDDYGGSAENRFRLLGEVISAVCTVFDSSRVGVRLSPNGAYNGMGDDNNREIFIDVVGRLVKYNLGYLHMVIGLGFGFHGFGEALTMKDIRKVYPGVLMANCGYDGSSAEAELASGDADLISFGRPFITNPDLVQRFATGAELAQLTDPSGLYSSVDHDMGASGYTDYPTMEGGDNVA